MRTLRYLMLCLFATFTLFKLQAAAAQEAAGQVMLASGKLEANQSSQAPRPLKRGSTFFSDDTLKTYAGSEAQLRFTDGTLVSLRPNTSLRIDQYKFDNKAAGAKDKNAKFAVNLIAGGFRSISGQIAKANPNEYKIRTGVATIGVRGTEFSLALDQNGGLGAATYKGLIYLKNAAGYIEIGDGADYSYAYIATEESEPKGEPILPSFMLNDPRIVGLTNTGRVSTSGGICLQ